MPNEGLEARLLPQESSSDQTQAGEQVETDARSTANAGAVRRGDGRQSAGMAEAGRATLGVTVYAVYPYPRQPIPESFIEGLRREIELHLKGYGFTDVAITTGVYE